MNRGILDGLLGPFPKTVPPDTELSNAADLGSYTRHRLEYTTEPGDRIAAYLLVPKVVSAALPAVVAHHQHAGQWDLGKSEVVGLEGDPDQAYGSELAERGYVVLAPDAIAFESRNWTPGSGRAQYQALTSRLLNGQTLMAKVIHDMRVALDVLRERPEVDPGRLGFIGHSYGGRMALWMPAFDPRIRASVSHCGCASYADTLAPDCGVQMEFVVPGVMQAGDLHHIVRMGAPAHMLISAAAEDKWSRGAVELHAAAADAFPDNHLELKVWPGGHRFAPSMREFAYAFLDAHL